MFTDFIGPEGGGRRFCSICRRENRIEKIEEVLDSSDPVEKGDRDPGADHCKEMSGDISVKKEWKMSHPGIS